MKQKVIFFIMLIITAIYSPVFANKEPLSVKLQLKWWEHQFQFAGYYAAIEKGYYTDEGLAVTLLPGGAEVDVPEAVTDGDADFGVFGAELVQKRLQGADVVLLAIIFQHSQRALFVDGRSAIVTPHDLKNKEIIINSKERAEFLAMFAAEGIAPEELLLQPKDKSSMQRLLSGEVAALNGNIANQPFQFRKMKRPVRSIRPIEYGVNFFGDALFTSEKFLKKNPEEVEAFRRASLKGWAYALANQEEIIDVIISKYHSTKSKEQLHYEAAITQSLILPNLVELGTINPRIIQNIANTYTELGLLNKKNSTQLDGFIYESPHRIEPSSALSLEELVWIAENPIIRVGHEMGNPPLEFLQNDTAMGFSIDLITLIAQQVGLTIDFVNGYSWPELLNKAKRREIDVLPLMAESKERSKYLHFTSSYLENPSVLVTEEQDTIIKTLSDLKGKRLCIIQGYYYHQILNDSFPDIEVVLSDTYLNGIETVMHGKADAFLGPQAMVHHAINHYFLSNVKVVGKSGHPSFDLFQGKIGVRSDRKILRNILEKGMKQLPGETVQKIRNKWLTYMDTPSWHINLSDEEKEWLREHPVIKLGYSSAIEPFLIKNNNGEFEGIVWDTYSLIAKQLGISLEVVDTLWPEVFKKIKSKEVDIIGMMSDLAARKNDLLISDNFIHFPATVYGNKSNGFSLNTLGDLKGLRVAYFQNLVFIDSYLQKRNHELELVPEKSIIDALKAVSSGKADVMLGIRSDAYFLTKEYLPGIEPIYIAATTELPSNTIAGIRNDWPEFRDILNKAIRAIPPRELNAILEKWGSKTAENSFLTTDEKAWLKEHPVIRVASDSEWEPIEFLGEDGTYQGLSIEYLRKIESLLGIRFEQIHKGWQELYAMGKNKELDLLSCVAKTEEREKYYTFSKPYITMKSGIFSRKDVSYISNMNLLQNKRIAVVENYAIHDYLTVEYPDIELRLVKTPEEGIQAVVNGEAFAFIDNTLITSHLIREKGYTDIRMVGETPFEYAQSFAVRNDWPQFRSILDKALAEISEAEQLQMYNRWVPLIQEKSADYTTIWRAGIVILVILILIVVWNRILVHQVAVRTADLELSEKKYRGIFETLQDGYLKADLEGNIILVNDVSCQLLGYTKESLSSLNMVQDIFYEQSYGNELENLLQEKGSIDSHEFLLRCQNGSTVIVEANIHIGYQDGIPSYYEGTFRDITKRKESEKAMARLASVIHQSSDDITITDTQGNIEYVNPAFEKILGYSFEEIRGKTPRVYKSEKHSAHFYKEMWDTITKGQMWSGNIINKNKNGTLVEEHATIFPVFDENNNIINYAAIKRDMTEFRKLESQLRQSQKMEAIGTLAGGIAHDFNNILSAILGYSEMALEETDPQSDLHGDIQQVLQAGMRAKDLVKQILAFSRQSEKELHPVKLQSVVKEALKLIRSSIPSTIEIKDSIAHECDVVMADPTQVHQIIMNLCTNAYHAMRDTGGVLAVSLEQCVIESEDAIQHIHLQPGKYNRLEISDTGCGISKANLERIFEPYFTTKAKGEGTGLGLAMVHGIVRSFQGDISVYSEEGKGTSFRIYLPVIEEKEVSDSVETKEIPGGSERILLVDDDVSLRDMLTRILTNLGYKVTAFSNSEETFNTFERSPHSFDLLLTDMTMPHMTGAELTQKALAIRPDFPVVLCTGYSESINAEKAKAIGIKGYVMKPVIKRDLANAIRSALDLGDSTLV